MGMCKCGGLTVTKPIDNYVVPGALLGVNGVTLVSGVIDVVCEKCGKGKVSIPDLPGLIAAVALTRVKLPFKLNGRELRFIRTALNTTAKDMAEYLKVTPETVSRWENDKLLISEQSEKLLRLTVIALLQDKAKAVDPEMEAVVQMDIRAVYEPSALAKLMQFIRVPFKTERKAKAEPLWSDDRKVA